VHDTDSRDETRSTAGYSIFDRNRSEDIGVEMEIYNSNYKIQQHRNQWLLRTEAVQQHRSQNTYGNPIPYQRKISQQTKEEIKHIFGAESGLNLILGAESGLNLILGR
jgi:hypothetical protein